MIGYGSAGRHVSRPVPLVLGGNNTIKVDVTSERSDLSSTYSVHVFRRNDQADLPSHLAALAAMDIAFDGRSGEKKARKFLKAKDTREVDGLLPRFDPSVSSYSAKVPHDTQIVSVVV